MIALKSSPKSPISVTDMRKGQIGVIVDWPVSYYIGKVVQRSYKDIFILGEEGYWDALDKLNRDRCKVIVLENNTELVIKDNQ